MAERLPRKAPAKRPTTSAVTHMDGCAGPRMESYEARGASALVKVERCQECGAKSTR